MGLRTACQRYSFPKCIFVFIGSAMTQLSPVVVAGGTLYAFTLFFTFVVAVLTGWGRRMENAKQAAENGKPMKRFGASKI